MRVGPSEHRGKSCGLKAQPTAGSLAASVWLRWIAANVRSSRAPLFHYKKDLNPGVFYFGENPPPWVEVYLGVVKKVELCALQLVRVFEESWRSVEPSVQ